jgi:hypothetical protein
VTQRDIPPNGFGERRGNPFGPLQLAQKGDDGVNLHTDALAVLLLRTGKVVTLKVLKSQRCAGIGNSQRLHLFRNHWNAVGPQSFCQGGEALSGSQYIDLDVVGVIEKWRHAGLEGKIVERNQNPLSPQASHSLESFGGCLHPFENLDHSLACGQNRRQHLRRAALEQILAEIDEHSRRSDHALRADVR